MEILILPAAGFILMPAIPVQASFSTFPAASWARYAVNGFLTATRFTSAHFLHCEIVLTACRTGNSWQHNMMRDKFLRIVVFCHRRDYPHKRLCSHMLTLLTVMSLDAVST